jgi:hypothetical protein
MLLAKRGHGLGRDPLTVRRPLYTTERGNATRAMVEGAEAGYSRQRPDTAGPLDSRGRLSRHDCGDADEQQVPFDSAQGRLSRAFGALGMTILRMRIQ